MDIKPVLYSELSVQPGNVDFGTCISFIRFEATGRIPELARALEYQIGLMGEILNQDFTRMASKPLGELVRPVDQLWRYYGLQKVDQVAELIRSELSQDPDLKLVICAVHKDTIENLRIKLQPDIKTLHAYPGSDPIDVEIKVRRFQEDKKYRLFVIDIEAAKESIALTSSHNMIFIEMEWEAEKNARVIKSCNRRGQKNQLQVRFVTIENSMEKLISEKIQARTIELEARMSEAGKLKPKTVVKRSADKSLSEAGATRRNRLIASVFS